jgi:hypothetical protein
MKFVIDEPKISKVSEQPLLKFQLPHFTIGKIGGDGQDLFHFIQQITTP